MTITYVNDLRLSEMATGDNSGTWGNVTNTNLELIGEALGYGTEAITTNADTHTSTIADGSTDPVRALYVEYTGTLDSACTITIAPNTVNKVCFIENGTSGSQDIIITQGSGANVTIPAGDTKAVYLNGAGSGAAVVDAFASLSVVDLKVQDDLTVTDDATIGGTLGVTGALTVTGGALLNGTTPTLTIGDAGAEDAKIVFDGNAADYHVGLDDSEDALQIGLGSALGTTPRITIRAAEVAVNDLGIDLNFRVESDDNANMLFVDGGDDRVGIGMVPDTTTLTVSGQVGTTNGTAGAPTHTFYGDADTGMYRSGANILGFSTNGTARATIAADGELNVMTGNLKIGTAGKGVDFSAYGSGTNVSSNLLDDYEEGTFAITLTWATPGNSSVSYAARTGQYVKVGRNVTFQCQNRLNVVTKGTASGDVTITGFPFAFLNTGGYGSSGLIPYITNLPITSGHTLVCAGVANATTATLFTMQSNGAFVNSQDPNTYGTINISGTYMSSP